MSASRPVIFAASPRPGGNSDAAAGHVARGLSGFGAEPELVSLRDYEVLACKGCSHCARDPKGLCLLREKDQAEVLFQKLMRAPAVVIASPIYFYHLPAGFKAWIDRAQSYYQRRLAGDKELSDRSGLPAYICLIAGRSRGQRLFDGSLLTLRYFLEPFGFEIREALNFRGLDAAGDLEADAGAVLALEALGRRAAQAAEGD